MKPKKHNTLVARNLTCPAAQGPAQRIATAPAQIGTAEFRRQLEGAKRWAPDSWITEEALSAQEARALVR